MTLVRLMYTSHLADPTSDGSILAHIRKVATERNKELHITGALVFGDDCFLQCIEGPTSEVNRLYARILGDSAHRDVRLVFFESVEARAFSDWTMKPVLITEKKRSVVQKYMRSDSFDPGQLRGQAALEFILELQASGA